MALPNKEKQDYEQKKRGKTAIFSPLQLGEEQLNVTKTQTVKRNVRLAMTLTFSMRILGQDCFSPGV